MALILLCVCVDTIRRLRFLGFPPTYVSSASTMPLSIPVVSCASAARTLIARYQADFWFSSRSRESWQLDTLFLAFSSRPMARNHFCSGILVFWKIVPCSTLKLLWQSWQFQRPIRFPSALRPTRTLPQCGQPGLSPHRTASRCSMQAAWSGKRRKISNKLMKGSYLNPPLLSSP